MRYKENYIPEPRAGLPRDLFKQRSYSIWSIDTILTRILDNPIESPFTVIEQFILEMDFCIYFAGDKPSKRIFKTARAVAEDILDHLLNS